MITREAWQQIRQDDPQMKALRLLKRQYHGGSEEYKKIHEAMHERRDELRQIHMKVKVDISRLPESLQDVAMEGNSEFSEEQRIRRARIPCDCGTKHHAHHINCPQHPVNQREDIGFK